MKTLFDEIEQKTESAFFNTIEESGAELKESEKKAGRQENLVIGYFVRVRRSTALGAARALQMNEASAKRCCSVLSKGDNPKLRMLGKEDMVMEVYGKKAHLYELIEPK